VVGEHHRRVPQCHHGVTDDPDQDTLLPLDDRLHGREALVLDVAERGRVDRLGERRRATHVGAQDGDLALRGPQYLRVALEGLYDTPGRVSADVDTHQLRTKRGGYGTEQREIGGGVDVARAHAPEREECGELLAATDRQQDDDTERLEEETRAVG